MYRESKRANVEDLKGKTVVKITETSESLMFETSDGECYYMYHDQDCCESVYIESIVGELSDLLDTPMLLAEEVSGEIPENFCEYEDAQVEWTFYKFATIKGYVDIRWYGSSNGYYGTGVSFTKIIG